MCKTNVKMDFYYANICKHEYEKNMTRLLCKIVSKTGVRHIERNERVLLLFIYFWGPNSRKFPRRLLCVHQVKKLFENLLN
jgi:hypothetical protein